MGEEYKGYEPNQDEIRDAELSMDDWQTRSSESRSEIVLLGELNHQTRELHSEVTKKIEIIQDQVPEGEELIGLDLSVLDKDNSSQKRNLRYGVDGNTIIKGKPDSDSLQVNEGDSFRIGEYGFLSYQTDIPKFGNNGRLMQLNTKELERELYRFKTAGQTPHIDVGFYTESLKEVKSMLEDINSGLDDEDSAAIVRRIRRIKIHSNSLFKNMAK